MYKLMILIKKSQNPEAFNKFYYDEFIPKVINMEGLEQIEFSTIQAPLGIVRAKENLTPYDLQIELYFQNRKHFQYFLTQCPESRKLREKLSKYQDSIFTITWGQPETISKFDLIAHYNDYVIQSSGH